MQLTPAILLLLSSLSLTTAAPIITTTQKSTTASHSGTCAHTQHPLSASRINLLSRPDLNKTTNQTITFSLPSAAATQSQTCTLRARFPPHWEVIDSRAQSGGEPLLVGVYDADGPTAGALVGEVRFAGGNWEAERIVTVSSFVCREKMAYDLKIVEGEGELGFVNGMDQGLKVEGGVEMVWGC